jgi:hypothetical protein
VTILIDMRSSGEKLGSAAVTVAWNQAAVVYVSHEAGATGVAPTVNASQAGFGRLRFSVADANGFAGRVELLKVTFRSAATASSGTVTLTASEVWGASYTDLLSKTVGASHTLGIR